MTRPYPSQPPRTSLLSRRLVASSVAVVAAMAIALLGLAVLVPDAPAERGPAEGVAPIGPQRAAASASPAAGAEPRADLDGPAVATGPAPIRPRDPAGSAPPPPARPREVFLTRQSSERLAACATAPALEREVRYAALRKLEEQDGARATDVALALLDEEEDGLLRTNAIALLVRSDDPRARAAIERLDPRGRRLAAALAERRR